MKRVKIVHADWPKDLETKVNTECEHLEILEYVVRSINYQVATAIYGNPPVTNIGSVVSHVAMIVYEKIGGK